MRSVITLIFLSLYFSLSSFSQSDEILRITLEQGKSDVFKVADYKVSKAYAYGTEDNLILFLINDVYIEHQMQRGIVYNFIFASNLNDLAPKKIEKNELSTDSSKILIVSSDSAAFRKFQMKAFPDMKSCDYPCTFQIGTVNGLKVFVTNSMNDTTVFKTKKETVRIELEENKSDVFKVDGEVFSKVSIYGTKENIIRFLINDKYIKHRMEEGSKYRFTTSENFDQLLEFFREDTKNKIVIIVDDPIEFLNIYNLNRKEKVTEITEGMSVKLDDIKNMNLLILSNQNLVNP